MIKHIVMWELKDKADGNSKAENAAMIKEKLESLRSEINQIKEIEVGVGVDMPGSTCDVVMYSVFDSQEDLDIYQSHPKHLEAVKFIKPVVSGRTAVDYIV